MSDFIRALIFWIILVSVIGCGKATKDQLVGTWNCPNITYVFEQAMGVTVDGPSDYSGTYTAKDGTVVLTLGGLNPITWRVTFPSSTSMVVVDGSTYTCTR